MVKKTKTVTISVELLDWIYGMITKKEFGSISHAIGKALLHLKLEYEK